MRDKIKLVSSAGGGAFPIPLTANATGALEIDLSKAKVPAGDYQLGFMWDWDALSLAGTVHVHPADDFSQIRLTHTVPDYAAETSPPELAFLTLAMIVSPNPAARRLYFDALPPNTLMHITSLAPVLSATSRYVYI